MKTIGKWQIEQSLGEGGQGWTFVVHRVGEREKFVLKKLKNPNRVERFRVEVEALNKLNHPNIIRIIDYELTCAEKRTTCFYVSEYCSRGDLSSVDLREMPLLDRLRLFRQVCEAMAAAHAKNLLHRDLKPENILMRSDGSLVVADFGLCLDLTQMEREADQDIGGRGTTALYGSGT